jgi:hypothetical protein
LGQWHEEAGKTGNLLEVTINRKANCRYHLGWGQVGSHLG